MYDYYIGIDPSINGTAITIISSNTHDIMTYFFTNIKKFSKSTHPFYPILIENGQRDFGDTTYFDIITNIIIDTIEDYLNSKTLILLEGYSYSSTGMIFSIGEFVGLLKYKLAIQNNIYFYVVPPATVKKYIHKGNANKTDLYKGFMESKFKRLERIGVEYSKGLMKFIDTFNINTDKITSPFGDILDSLYISLFALEEK